MTEHNAHIRVRKLVAYNERGYRIGSTHHNATIPDEQVAMVLELYDSGMGYLRIAAQLGMARNTVRYICLCRRRAQTPHHWRAVSEGEITPVAE